MASTSPITICSNALLMLGSKPIASFDEAAAPANLDRARLCANLYPMVKLSVLRRHPWNCAIRRVQLSPDATAPAFGFQYRYALPGDWLRTLAVGASDYDRITYRSEGRFLLSDEPIFPLVYLADVAESDMDAMLVEIMTLAMAEVLAYPITASTSVQDAQYQKLRMAMKQAGAVDGQDDPPETLGDFRLLGARLGGGFGS